MKILNAFVMVMTVTNSLLIAWVADAPNVLVPSTTFWHNSAEYLGDPFDPSPSVVSCMSCTAGTTVAPAAVHLNNGECPSTSPYKVFDLTRIRFECVHPQKPNYVFAYKCQFFTTFSCDFTHIPKPDCTGECNAP